MLFNGIDVRTAAGRLGHARASTTLDVYAHYPALADQTASTTLAGLLPRPPVFFGWDFHGDTFGRRENISPRGIDTRPPADLPAKPGRPMTARFPA